MIEAQIICSAPVEIPDLGLDLSRGEKVWVNDRLARNSQDLRRAIETGKVRVYRKNRRAKKVLAKAPARPPPPFVQRSRPKPRVYEQPEPIETIIEKTTIIEQTIDPEEVARQVKTELLGDLRNTVAEEIGKAMAAAQEAQMAQAAQASPPPPQAVVAQDPEQMAALIETVIKRVQQTQEGGNQAEAQKPQVPADPLYMPTNIVDKDAKAAISVSSKTSDDDGGVDDAAAALRALKKKRKT